MEDESVPAAFSDRLVAFFCDLALILLLYYAITLAFVHGAPRLLERPAVSEFWRYTAVLVFVLYHAVLGSSGRRTPGKALLGVRVVGADGADLSFPRALARSAASLISTAALGLGFLWALGGTRRAWHDRLAGTSVIETRAKTGAVRGAITVASWGLGLLMLAMWFFVLVVAPGYAQRQMVANAQVGLQSVARLEHAYHDRTGAYAPDLDALLGATGREPEFKAELGKIVDMSSLKIQGSKDAYVLEAAALDEHRTVITIRSTP